MSEREIRYARALPRTTHDDAKDFFTRVVLIVSKDESLTKAHGRSLESRIIAAIRVAGRAKLVNGTEPSFKGVPEPEIADMERVLDEIEVLLPVLGFDLLRPAGKETLAAKSARQLQARNDLTSPPKRDVFTFIESGTSARAREVSDKFVVLEGSLVRQNETPSCSKSIHGRCEQLIADGRLVPDGDGLYRFNADTAFESPLAPAALSMAAASTDGATGSISIVGKVTVTGVRRA